MSELRTPAPREREVGVGTAVEMGRRTTKQERTMSFIPANGTTKGRMFKVLCPIERKDGKTHWMRVGSGFPNRDLSINLYLDVLPANLKLQLREMDDEDLQPRSTPRRDDVAAPRADAVPF
jgi:hypothetical protein